MPRKVRFVNRRKYGSPPADEPWVWHPTALLASPAWRGASINLRRLIDFLEIEHSSHGGRENGNLLATYDQLEDFGIDRSAILDAIKEGDRRGLIRCEHGYKLGNSKRTGNRFRLTYFYTYTRNPETKAAIEIPPTDDWKRFRDPGARARKQIPIPKIATAPGPENLESSPKNCHYTSGIRMPLHEGENVPSQALSQNGQNAPQEPNKNNGPSPPCRGNFGSRHHDPKQLNLPLLYRFSGGTDDSDPSPGQESDIRAAAMQGADR